MCSSIDARKSMIIENSKRKKRKERKKNVGKFVCVKIVNMSTHILYSKCIAIYECGAPAHTVLLALTLYLYLSACVVRFISEFE